MRASELIGSPVVDESGQAVGVVRDLRLAVDEPAPDAGFPIVALVLGEPGLRSAAAHAWGFAQGRAAGPSIIRRLLGRAAEGSVVPAERVLDWGPERVRIGGGR